MFKKLIPGFITLFISSHLNAASVAMDASQQAISTTTNLLDSRIQNNDLIKQMVGSSTTASSLDDVIKFIDQQDYSQAQKKLDEILSLDPKNAAAHALKGFVFMQENKLNKGVTELQLAIKLKPRSPELHAQLALLFLKQSKRLESEQQVFAALELDQNQPQALLVLARLHEEVGKIAKAITLIQRSLTSAKTRNLNIFPAVTSLAQLYNRVGYFGATHQLLQPIIKATNQSKHTPPLIVLLFTEASLQTAQLKDAKLGIEQLRHSAEIAQSLDFIVLKARYLFASGQQEQAIALLEKSIKSSKQNKSMLRYALFNLLKKNNQVNKAADVLERAINSEPQAEFRAILLRDFSNYLFLENQGERVLNLTRKIAKQYPNDLQLGYLHASAEKYQGHNKAALEILNKLIQQQADFASAYALKAKVLSRLKRTREAEDALRKALKIDPSRIKDWISLAYMAHHSGGHQGLLAVINEGLKYNPDNVELKLEIAAVHNEEGDLDGANKIYQDILAKNKTNVSALMHIAHNLAQQKDSKLNALEFIQQAKQLAPENPNVIAGYGWVLHLMGNNSEALDSLKTAAKRLPKSGQLHYWIATTLSALGNKADAKKELELALQLGLNTSEKKQALQLIEQLK